MENPASLLRRLNPCCARAMEGAASLCQSRAHAEILPEHWLLKLLEQGEGDLTVAGAALRMGSGCAMAGSAGLAG